MDISGMFYEIMGENSTVDAESVLEAIAEADELYRQRTGSYFPKAFLEEKLRELADALAWLKSDVQKGK